MQSDLNPYDFILAPDQNKKGSGLPIPDGRKKIVLIVGFMAGILVLIIVGINIFLSLGKPNNSDLIQTQAYQTELSRVIDLGLKNTGDPTLRNTLTTLRATLSTDQAAVADILSKRKETVTKLQLKSKENSKTDETLESAKQSGNYDDALLKAVTEINSNYYKQLKNTLADATTDTEKKVLKTAISNLELSSQTVTAE
jgi:hypothetical protein